MRYNDIELHNVCDIIEQQGQDGFQISRVPREILSDINERARNMAGMSTGCEIRGMLAAGGKARVVLQTLDDNVTPAIVTVYHGCFVPVLLRCPGLAQGFIAPLGGGANSA
ncbi:MAG: hypothetical protein R6V56_05985 [Lentisphaeria bacterium]